MLWASMPEASVNENCYPLDSKHEVWRSFNVEMSAPAADAMSAKKCNQCKFSRLVAPTAYAGHDLRALLLGVDVGHAFFCG